MVSSIVSNTAAYAAQANIAKASADAASSIARLSSGNRIVKSSDDVAGLAVGTSLATQVTTLKAALANANQGTSLLQVADGALQQINDILQRQKAIAVQAGSGSLSDTDRGFLNQEFQGLSAQIDQIATSTNFNGVNLLSGGLGASLITPDDSATAAQFAPSGVGSSDAPTAADTASPIQAFDNTGADLSGVGTPGDLDITDSSATLLTTGYDSVNSALYGQFSSFKFSAVTYGAAAAGSATLTATINGVDFTGTATGGNSAVLVHNGNTYINLGVTTLDFTDAGTTSTGQAQMGADFANTYLERTSAISGVDFSGTALAGAVGGAGNSIGLASARLSAPTANIQNFQYAGNLGTSTTNEISVQINGKTFLATGIADDLAAPASDIAFQSQDGELFVVDLTGLTTDFTDIRNTPSQQTALINALNEGFSKAGSGLNFSIGSTSADNINVSLGSAATSSLYNGATLSVGTAPDAAAASTTIDGAINSLSTIQSSVGALESRFNFASANLQASVQNEDAARGQFLDTDVSSESTAYAASQVQLQAGIAVLAQANLLPQNLLKLIQ